MCCVTLALSAPLMASVYQRVWENVFPIPHKTKTFSSREQLCRMCPHIQQGTCMCWMFNAWTLFPVGDSYVQRGQFHPVPGLFTFVLKRREASHQPAGPPDGITPSLLFSVVGRGKPGYKWWSPGVWLQNQRGRAAAAATELSAMIVIRGLCCQPFGHHLSRTHTHIQRAHTHTLKSRTLA